MLGVYIIALLILVLAGCILPWWFFPVVVLINLVIIFVKGMITPKL